MFYHAAGHVSSYDQTSATKYPNPYWNLDFLCPTFQYYRFHFSSPTFKIDRKKALLAVVCQQRRKTPVDCHLSLSTPAFSHLLSHRLQLQGLQRLFYLHHWHLSIYNFDIYPEIKKLRGCPCTKRSWAFRSFETGLWLTPDFCILVTSISWLGLLVPDLHEEFLGDLQDIICTQFCFQKGIFVTN